MPTAIPRVRLGTALIMDPTSGIILDGVAGGIDVEYELAAGESIPKNVDEVLAQLKRSFKGNKAVLKILNKKQDPDKDKNIVKAMKKVEKHADAAAFKAARKLKVYG